jgi:hypothetical protein
MGGQTVHAMKRKHSWEVRVTDVGPAGYESHPLHTLISWPAVFAGAVVAVAAGAMLNLLGVALGAGALNPFDISRGGAKAFTVGAGLWVALANTIALFAGGFVASRAAKYADHHHGMLHGLTVWAIAFLLAIFVAGSTAAGGITSALDAGADNAAISADTVAVAPSQQADTAPQQGGVLQSDGSVAAPDSGAAPAGGAPAAAPPAPPPVAAQKTVDATASIALWAFLTMLLGAAGAVFGGRYGSRKHTWESRGHHVDRPATHLPPTL